MAHRGRLSKRTDAVSRERANQDGWVNLLKGFGAEGTDARLSTTIQKDRLLTEQELNAIYSSEGMGARLIDVLVEDMTREWFSVTGDTEDTLDTALAKFGGRKAIVRCVRWSLLHGGALGVLGIDDGGSYETPYEEGKPHKGVKYIHVFDRWRVQVRRPDDLYQDPNEPKFNEPEFYRVTPIGGQQFRVHESRVLRFDGKDCPDADRVQNNGWGFSELQSVYDRLRGLGAAYAGIETVVNEFVIAVLSVRGLQGLIASGQEPLIKKRLLLIDMCKRMMGSVLVDEQEQYQRMGAPVGGLPECMRELVLGMSAATGIPVTRLMGQSPAGLNATGDSDIRLYYDHIGAMQEERLDEPLTKLARIVYAGAGMKPPSDNWEIEFEPLWQPTEAEIIDMRNKQAATDVSYINAGVLSPEEVANSRFGGEQWSKDTKLEYDRKAKPPEEREPSPETAPSGRQGEGLPVTDGGERLDGGPGSGNFGHLGRPGLVGGSTTIRSVVPVKDRAWEGRPVRLKTIPSSQERGRLGEAIFLASAGALGFRGKAEKLHEAGDTKACDVRVGNAIVEVKTGSASNRPDAAKWRTTFDTSAKEKALLARLSPAQRMKYNNSKLIRAMQRKAALVKAAGPKAKAFTVGLIIDTDRKIVDAYKIPGHHKIIRWRNAAPYYAGSFSYEGGR